jgi:DNA-binding beta-propeller fold protein YncE
MSMRFKLLAAVLALAACQPANAPDPQAAAPPPPVAPAMREIAFIANSEGGTVSLLDVARQKIVATIDTNPEEKKVERPGTPNYAQDTDISPDGKTLYVSRGYMGDVAAFDIATGKPLWVHSLDTVRADHMTITPDGKYLFVSVLMDARVARLDAKTGEETGRFISGIYPHDNQISADGKSVYNTSLGNLSQPLAKRDVIDTPSDKSGYAYEFTTADVETLEVTHRIRMPVGVRPWHMKPDGAGFYAQLSDTHGVVAFDFPSARESKRLDLPRQDGVTDADWDFSAPHHGLALSHDGSTLCLAGRASDYAALVKAPELELLATIPVADAPGWAAFADGDRTCIIASTRADTISLISVADRKETVRIPGGDGPKHITVAQIPSEVVEAAASR